MTCLVRSKRHARPWPPSADSGILSETGVFVSDSTDNRHIIILVIGILSVVMCPCAGPVAIFMGNNYRRAMIVDGQEPEQLAGVGRILGFVGTAILLLCVISLSAFAILQLFVAGG